MIRIFRSGSALTRAAYIFAREGLVRKFAPPQPPWIMRFAIFLARLIEKRTGSAGSGLSPALERLGPSYIKLGQFLATRPDLVGKSLATSLSTLHDKALPFSQDEAKKVILDEFGQPVDGIFSDFGPPIAAASMAQVHKASLADVENPRRVAVKILRPGIEQRFNRDLDSFYLAASVAETLSSQARRLRPIASVDILARSAVLEMDLRMEAAALNEIAEKFADNPDYRTPAVLWEYSSRRVLTLEWIDGIKISDAQALAAAGHDLKAIGAKVIEIFLTQALRDGFFHADMHQGNLFVDEAGCIVALDFGIMGRIGKPEQRFLAEILYGFVRRDYQRIAEVHFEAGYVPAHHAVMDFAQALRAIGEPIHGQPASQISMGRLLTQLFEVTALFEMETRPELILLQKTMVVAEGVARILDPELNMWTAAKPVVSKWMEHYLGPAGQLERATENITAARSIFTQLPKIAAQLSKNNEEQGSSHCENRNRRMPDHWRRNAFIAIGILAGLLFATMI